MTVSASADYYAFALSLKHYKGLGINTKYKHSFEQEFDNQKSIHDSPIFVFHFATVKTRGLIMKKHILLGLLSSGLLFSQTSNAGEWGIGVQIGQGSIDNLKQSCADNALICDDKDTSLGLNLSYGFNKAWGIELGYMDLGEFGGKTVINDVSADISIGASALYLAGTGTANFNDKWSLTGRLGITNIDVNFDGSVINSGTTVSSSSESESGAETYAGISLNYNFNDNLQAQLRYDHFAADSAVDSFAFGLKYSFGK